MDRKYVFPLILIAIWTILIVIFSANLLFGGYSIEFYKNYDEDNKTESNPILEHPIPYVFRNSTLTPVYIAVLVNKGQKPAFSENVTLDIWNQDSHHYIEKKTNSEGYAVFVTAVKATRNTETVYSYRLYLNNDEKIATDVRNIIILKDPVDLGIDNNLEGLTTDYGFDPVSKKPSDIPEGDNLIVVGVLTIMLTVYLVTRRRDV